MSMAARAAAVRAICRSGLQLWIRTSASRRNPTSAGLGTDPGSSRLVRTSSGAGRSWSLTHWTRSHVRPHADPEDVALGLEGLAQRRGELDAMVQVIDR